MGKSVVKATGVVLVMNLISKLLGFMRETALASAFGASSLSDAYLSAYTIPYFLQAILGMALVTVVVPILTKYLVKDDKENVSYVGSAIINVTALALTGVTIVGMLSCSLLVSLLAPGYDEAQQLLTTQLAVIMFPSLVFMGVGMVFTGICNAHYKFAASALAPGVSNIIIIISLMFFAASYGIFGAAWGTLISFVGYMLIQIPVLWQIGFRYKPVLALNHPDIKQMFRDIMPIVLGVAVNQVYFAINRIFASGLAEGTISNINYANKLMMLPIGIFVAAVASAIYPTLSEYALRDDRKSLAEATKTGLVSVLLVALPAAAGLAVLAEPIVELLFERGEFDHDATLATATALIFFTIGLIPMSANMILTKVFYALEDVKTPVRIAAWSILVDVALSFMLYKTLSFGGGGLALSNSLAALTCCLWMYYHLKRKSLPELKGNTMIKSLVKMAVATLIMAVCVGAVAFVLAESSVLIITAAGVMVGVVAYFAALLVLKVPELDFLLQKVLGKFKK